MQAIKSSDHIALLALLHWAVLCHRAGYDLWYMKCAGKTLVAEVSDNIDTVDNALLAVALNWAREQVGLKREQTMLEATPS